MDAMILFVATIVFGGIAIFFSFRSKKFGYKDHEKLLKFRAYGILLIYIGFSMHTLGDALSAYYGEAIELLLESVAHVIILASFIFFYKSAVETIKNTKEYWFK